jgi:phage terminase large subunit-like protein
MYLPVTSSLIACLASQPDLDRAQILASLTDAQAAELLYEWREWARPQQIAPDGDWQTWLVLAGRGFGKTRTGAEWVREKIKAGAGRVALVAPTASDARDVMVEGESGLLAVCWDGDQTASGKSLGRPIYEPSKRRVTWGNGAVAALFSAEEPERLRGPQHEAMWCDELAAWKYLRDTWDMAMFGLRLGEAPQVCITTTPKPSKVLKEIMAAAGTKVTRGSTYDNRANLAPSFVTKIISKYEGTRLGRQELRAEVLEDVPGALWTREMIDQARAPRPLPDMARIIIGVDPSGTSGAATDGEEKSNSVGIVAAGRGVDGHAYVLGDWTCDLSPKGWGRRTVEALSFFKGDRIVAEVNFGGAMVAAVIKAVDARVPVKMVTASRGKVVRAEPISALYEQGRVHHVGKDLEQLEDQMCAMTSEGFMGDGSPDRVDAKVWALTELMLTGGGYGMLSVV